MAEAAKAMVNVVGTRIEAEVSTGAVATVGSEVVVEEGVMAKTRRASRWTNLDNNVIPIEEEAVVEVTGVAKTMNNRKKKHQR